MPGASSPMRAKADAPGAARKGPISGRPAGAPQAAGGGVWRPVKEVEETSEGDVLAEVAERVAVAVKQPWFDGLIGVVIVANAITIGMEQTLTIRGDDATVARALEHVFLVIYIVELGLRFLAFRAAALHERWVLFDVFLVVLGVVTTWIVEPIVKEPPGAMGPLLVLRTTRLLRLGKTMKFFFRVQECRLLLRGFVNSASIIMYTFVVWFLTLYVFSCLGVEIITKHSMSASDPEFAAVVHRYFHSLPQTMVTLVRFACLDNTGEVYQPLVEKDPWLIIYFAALIMIVSVVLFHTLGAVIFSCMLDQNTQDHEVAKASKQSEWEMLVLDLRDMFVRLDADRSGCLSRKEIANIDDKDKEKLTEALGLATPMQVFDALDVDRSGEISISEFFDGVWECVLAKGSLHLKRMEKQVETSHWRLKEMFSAQHEIKCELTRVIDVVTSLKLDMDAVRGEARGAARQLSADSVGGTWSPQISARGAFSGPAKVRGGSGGKGDDRGSVSSGRSTASATAPADDLIGKLERILEESLAPTLAQMRQAASQHIAQDLVAAGPRPRRCAATPSPRSASGRPRSGAASPERPPRRSPRQAAPAPPPAAAPPTAAAPPMGDAVRSTAANDAADAAVGDAICKTEPNEAAGAPLGSAPPPDSTGLVAGGGRPAMTSIRVQM